MFEKLQSFFKGKSRRQAIKAEIAKIENESPKNEAERLAMATCEWVELLWNGTKQKFFIHKTDFQEYFIQVCQKHYRSGRSKRSGIGN